MKKSVPTSSVQREVNNTRSVPGHRVNSTNSVPTKTRQYWLDVNIFLPILYCLRTVIRQGLQTTKVFASSLRHG
ncbi:hypothetical protein C0J52_16716 [Blattella germanica]|nr:hypothetical protein C0J52_16716 [Blattella germanica]